MSPLHGKLQNKNIVKSDWVPSELKFCSFKVYDYSFINYILVVGRQGREKQ